MADDEHRESPIPASNKKEDDEESSRSSSRSSSSTAWSQTTEAAGVESYVVRQYPSVQQQQPGDCTLDRPVTPSPPSPPPPPLITIFPVAPPVVEMDVDALTDLKNSEAYRCLEHLYHDGQLTATRMAHLKVKYAELNATLKQHRGNEGDLRQKVRQFGQTIDDQRQQLVSADAEACSPRAVTGQLRCIVLDYRNELNETNERLYRLHSIVEGLEIERRQLQDKYESMPNAQDMELKIKQLTTAVSALTRELASRRVDRHSLQGDLDNHVIYIGGLMKDLEECRQDIDTMKFDAEGLAAVRSRLAKDCEKLTRQQKEEEERLQAVRAEFRKLNDDIVLLSTFMDDITEQKRVTDAETAARSEELSKKEQAFSLLKKNYEFAKEQARWLTEDRVVLDINRKHAHHAFQHLTQQVARLTHDKVQDLIQLKKKEVQKRQLEESCVHLADMIQKVGTLLIAYPRVDEASREQKHRMQREVNELTRLVMRQNVSMVTELKNVEELMMIEEKLLYVESGLQEELHGLTLAASIRYYEREFKARDYMRAQLRFVRAEETLRLKNAQIDALTGKLAMNEAQLTEHEEFYRLMRSELNKVLKQLQQRQQKIQEMNQKSKMMSNEGDVLVTSARLKSKQLRRHGVRLSIEIAERNSLRHELRMMKMDATDSKFRTDAKHQEVGYLNKILTRIVKETEALRRRYDMAIKERNKSGIELVAWNEETCTFHERANFQAQMLNNGEIELRKLDEEIRLLNVCLADERRSVENMRKEAQLERNLLEEKCALERDLHKYQCLRMAFEGRFGSAKSHGRTQPPERTDPPIHIVKAKIDDLQDRLVTKEGELMEKDLVLEQVMRLVERLQKAADRSKGDSLQIATLTNKTLKRIDTVTHRMMSIVAELSVFQGQASTLSQQVEVSRAELDRLMKDGAACSQDVEDENTGRCKSRPPPAALPDTNQTSGTDTQLQSTAIQRPSCYFPDVGLPVPKAYGAKAPFMPSEQGANMRHYRQPQQAPLNFDLF